MIVILDPAARARLVAAYDHGVTRPEGCTGYRWDIVLTGSHETWTRAGRRRGTGMTGTPDLTPTPGQTVGPFFGTALPYAGRADLVGPHHPRAIRLHGTAFDGDGAAVPDALLEIRQPDENDSVATESGSLRRDGWTFTGIGRAQVDGAGRYTFTTVGPGATEPGKAPFIAVTVFARGLMNRLFTRCYLSEDTAALAADPLLASLPEDRRATLVALREADGGLRFDVRLQGDAETVFLAYPRHPGHPRD